MTRHNVPTPVNLRSRLQAVVGCRSDLQMPSGPGGDFPLLNGLVEYWDLSGDYEGKYAGIDATGVNSPGTGLGVDGVSTCVAFVGASSQRLVIPDASLPTAGDVTWFWAGWIYVTSGDPFFIGKTWNAGSWTCVGFGGNLQFATFSPTAVATWLSFGTGAWRFVEMWVDADADIIGVRVNRGVAVTAARSDPIGSEGGAITFGADVVWGHLTGRMQAVGFWSIVPPAELLDYLYNGGAGARLYADISTYAG